MAYAGIGLTADGGASWTLPRVIGMRATQEMAYLGRRLDAAEAASLGLVTRVVPADRLDEEARTIALGLAAGPTLAFGGMKRLLRAGDDASFATQLDAEAESIGVTMATDDAKGAIAAFLDRRKPTFVGR